jgi:hypothetical protein
MSIKTNNMKKVLVIGDLHIPAEHPNALEFCKKIYAENNCDTVVFLGDILDLHRASFHDHDPEMPSLADEINLCRQRLAAWSSTFHNAYICEGNHDLRLHRVASKAGIPSFCLRDINNIFGLPDTWVWSDQHIIDNVKYKHIGPPGPTGQYKAVTSERMSVVYGHIHSFAGIVWSASKQDLLFAMNAGWLGDEELLAFRYAKSFVNRGVVGVATVMDGKYPVFHPMDLGSKIQLITKLESVDGYTWLSNNYPDLIARIPAQMIFRLRQIKNVQSLVSFKELPSIYEDMLFSAIKRGSW